MKDYACPICGSNNIKCHESFYKQDMEEHVDSMSCIECGSKWENNFRLESQTITKDYTLQKIASALTDILSTTYDIQYRPDNDDIKIMSNSIIHYIDIIRFTEICSKYNKRMIILANNSEPYVLIF